MNISNQMPALKDYLCMANVVHGLSRLDQDLRLELSTHTCTYILHLAVLFTGNGK